MAKRKKIWIKIPPRQPKPKVPDNVKMEVEIQASELTESVLKPEHVKAHVKEERFNYIVDIYTKWYHSYFYFCAKYRSPAPNAISPFFDVKFARMEYVGNGRFNLSYMRHTGQWWEIYTSLSIDECMALIKDEPHFLP
ncbi:MAG: hypothetical protein JRI22_00300 [Deltaproteobacteria bacterium]|nr:hypothetical protein [Deltaproteobacteria bacterium]